MATEQQHPCCFLYFLLQTSLPLNNFFLRWFQNLLGISRLTTDPVRLAAWLFYLCWCFHYGFNEFSHICCWQMLPQEKWKAICLSSQQNHRHTFLGCVGVCLYVEVVVVGCFVWYTSSLHRQTCRCNLTKTLPLPPWFDEMCSFQRESRLMSLSSGANQ